MPRYFLMRCADAQLLKRAEARSLWPVSFGALDRLNEAFHSGEQLTLVFTITGSSAFQGVARMITPADKAGAEAWGSTMPVCRIEWLLRKELPYAEAEHLINPLSDPPQPVRAAKDGTEIEASVAEELISLLEKAAPPKPAPKPALLDGGSEGPSAALPGQQQRATLAAAGVGGVPGMAGMGGMPGLVGGGLMGMTDPSAFWMGMNPMMAMGMMNPLMAAGMMNPVAAAMMMGAMPGMMAGMRPQGLSAGLAPGIAGGAIVAAGAESGDGDGAKDTLKEESAAGAKQEGAEKLLDGPPPGFDLRRYDRREERYAWQDRERYAEPGGGYRDGPPHFRDGPPPRDYGRLPGRAGVPFYGDFDRAPGFDRGFDWRLSPPPDFRGPPPLREREPLPRDDRPDILRMTYEEYVERFNQIKDVASGGRPVGGKENGAPGDTAAGASSREEAHQGTAVP